LRAGGLRADVAAETERVGFLAHRGNAKTDVLFEGNAEFFRAFADVFAAHSFCEGFVFEPALHGVHFEIENALGRADVRTCREKSGELVACEKRVFEWRLPRDSGIISMRKNGANDLFGITAFAQNF